eukprot:g1646.t1
MDTTLRNELRLLLQSTYREDIRITDTSNSAWNSLASMSNRESLSQDSNTPFASTEGDTGELIQEHLEWEEEREIRKEKAKYILGGSRTSESLKNAVERAQKKKQRKRKELLRAKQTSFNSNGKRNQLGHEKNKRRKRKKTATNLRERGLVNG